MIIRTAKNKNYTVINNTVLEDARLSWEAKGLAAYLLSKPDNWHINVDHLWHASANGYQAVKRILRELEKRGYLLRKRTRDEKGKFAWEVVLYETPQPVRTPPAAIGQEPSDGNPSDGNPSDGNPSDEKPSDGKPSDGNPSDIVNTDTPILKPNTEKTTEKKARRGRAPKAPPTPPPAPVAVYHEVHGKYPQKEQWSMLEEEVTDLEQWRLACEAWRDSGYNYRNLRGQLEWYREPYLRVRRNGANGQGTRFGPMTKADQRQQASANVRRMLAERGLQ